MASISIRALNEAAHLPRLFDGIARQTRKPDEIVLVDSGSMDDSVAAINHEAQRRLSAISAERAGDGRVKAPQRRGRSRPSEPGPELGEHA